jgi:phosphate-selective porin OprO/OprP
MSTLTRWTGLCLWGAIGVLFCQLAQAQSPSPSPAAPGAPKPARAVAAAVEARPGRQVELEDEVQQLKAMVRDLSSRVEQLSGELAATRRPVAPEGGEPAVVEIPALPELAPGGVTFGPPDAAAGSGGSAAARGPLDPRRTTRFDMPAVSANLPTTGIFGPGFQFQTRDAEFQLQFHDLTQVDGRFYTQGQQVPVTSTFLIPRQWFIFAGRLTKPFEYYLSAAEGIDNLNILDVFFNVNFDQRLQFKIGRFKSPFTYEFYGLPINGFITPERSLFFNNFGLNRDIGLMAWGRMFDNRFDYAASIVNGTRNGYVDSNDFKDFSGLVNFRPFANWTDHWLENLNFGGSTDTGLENNTPVPQVFRTNVATTGNLAIGPEFLALNKNVNESGLRAFWSMHIAYYYRRLSLIGEWQSGFDSYALVNQNYRTRVPVQSYYVMAGYFLTGESVSGRGVVRPLRNFDVRPGRVGPGALELVARYNYLNIGRQVFTSGFADPALWTNQLFTVDLGVNWYWTQYIKFYLGWQHAGFGTEVLFAPERFHTSSDQYWLRFQVFF